MAESAAETKKIIDPRVEIDTSPPFESVKEAVDRFGGSGPWIPHHLLRLAAAHHHNNEAFDVERIEEETVQLERDLIIKEQQTLNVLKELESAKRFVEGLKLNLMPHFSSFMDSPADLSIANQIPPPGFLMFNDLTQAKLNLTKTSVDLAAIQASVESLNSKLRKDKILLHRPTTNCDDTMQVQEINHHHHHHHLLHHSNNNNNSNIEASLTLSKQVNFEAEQFKKMTEASRYEVMKAMAEIERTKNCIRMAEMRLNAAKKMEEAAKAVEAIAVAQRNVDVSSSSSSSSSPDGITLSFEEYKALSQKAKQGEQMCKTKFIDTNGLNVKEEQAHDEPILEKFEETTNENKVSFNQEGPNHTTNVVIEDSFSRSKFSKFKFRNSQRNNAENEARDERPNPGFRSSASIGNVLNGRKVILKEEVVMGRSNVEGDSERQHHHVSLSQMLREQSRLILNPSKTTGGGGGEGNVQKQYFMQRKKFGFIQVPIPTKQTKKKTAAPS